MTTLTVSEADGFQKRSIKGFDENGKPEFNFDEINDIRYEKIALCLIEPKMTVDDLRNLDASATKALIEIEAVISGMVEEPLDSEGK